MHGATIQLLRNHGGRSVSQCMRLASCIFHKPEPIFVSNTKPLSVSQWKRKSHTQAAPGHLIPALWQIDKKQDCWSLSHSGLPTPVHLNYFWLREHCRCKACYNSATNQRILTILDISPDITPVDGETRGNSFLVKWSDGHLSDYSIPWLLQNVPSHFEAVPLLPQTWTADSYDSLSIQRVGFTEFMTQENGLRDVVSSIIKFGIGFVEDVPVSAAGTQQAVERIAHVHKTFFGDMWEFGASFEEHKDTAYTSIYLGPHTDTTYLTEAAGIQVFHCTRKSLTGGETILVDGFAVAQALKQEDLEAYSFLQQTPTEAEYIEPGRYYKAVGPMFRHNPLTGKLEQVRFNLYDRAPLSSVQFENLPQYYSALRTAAKLFYSPEFEVKEALRPGLVLFIDNWRVLHGRTAFVGARKMAGCYLARSDMMSCARTLGLVL